MDTTHLSATCIGGSPEGCAKRKVSGGRVGRTRGHPSLSNIRRGGFKPGGAPGSGLAQLRGAPDRGEPRLPLTRLARRPVVMLQFDEPRCRQVPAPGSEAVVDPVPVTEPAL